MRRWASGLEIRNKVANASATLLSPNSAGGAAARAATSRWVMAAWLRVRVSHCAANPNRSAVLQRLHRLTQQIGQLRGHRRDALADPLRLHGSNTSSTHRHVFSALKQPTEIPEPQ